MTNQNEDSAWQAYGPETSGASPAVQAEGTLAGSLTLRFQPPLSMERWQDTDVANQRAITI